MISHHMWLTVGRKRIQSAECAARIESASPSLGHSSRTAPRGGGRTSHAPVGEYPAIGPVGVNDSDEDSSLSAAHLRIFEQMCSSDLNIPPDFSQLIATRCERRKPMIY